ncbi:MAG: type I restriction endonuclease [Nostocaceae cyanobacterium]|nr:type I restriction endonuclease [Nostocaceae cyanobacterium]
MVKVIQAQDVTPAYLEERFGLQQTYDEQFFIEWLTSLPEISELDKPYLDRVKENHLSLLKNPPLLEDAVKLVVLSPLLDLAGFYRPPFRITTEKSIQISLEDEGEIVRGRIDVLVLQQQLWIAVIEAKRSDFAVNKGIPQALAYMLANPNSEKPSFGLVMNGSDFLFIKLTKQAQPTYALSDQFTLFKRENELYKVLSILKKIGQIIRQ